MFPFPFLFLFLFQRVLCVTLNYIYNWAESRTTVNWQLLMVSVLAMLGIRKLLLTQAINMRRRQSEADVSRIRTVCRQYFQIINSVPIQHDQLTVAWAISMAMTRTPDQLIKITVLKLRQGACGMVHGAWCMWRVASGEKQVASAELTCIHLWSDMRVLHKLSANYVADALCFPDFPQQQPCQRNLSREQQEELKWSRQLGGSWCSSPSTTASPKHFRCLVRATSDVTPLSQLSKSTVGILK